MTGFNKVFQLAARLDRVGITVTRIGLVVVLLWIGGLKVFAYEDEGIVPFVLGSVIVLYGVLIALHPWLPRAAAMGSFLVFLMSLVTLSFLVTTPEAWVQPLGSPEHGFPLLSGGGRLVVKDAIMMGAALVTMADSAKGYLRKRKAATHEEVHQQEGALAAY
jgi:uncharacterized membrane protein YkgB